MAQSAGSGQKKAGSVIAGFGDIFDAEMENKRGKYLSRRLYERANNTLASSQREAEEIRRQKRLLQSRAQAVAAFSGGDTTDFSVVDALADIEQEGEFRALTALYEGKSAAAGLRDEAKMAKYRGKQARLAGWISGASKIFGGS